jgi:predicted CoA-binding protein
MITRKQIENFLEPKRLAIAGVSRKPEKFGYKVYIDLKKKGFELYLVNPFASEINGEKCYKHIADVPADVKHLLILTPKTATDALLIEAINRGINNIWVQQMSETKNTLHIAEEHKINLIYKKCIFMFAEPVSGIHKFHKAILKLFGRLPDGTNA